MYSQENLSTNDYSFEIDGSRGSYWLTWNNMNITAKVSRLKEDTHYDLKGEIKVESSRPSSSGHIAQGRVILTSPANRKTFASACEARDGEIDWIKVLEQLSVAVLDEWRQGSPAIELTGDALVAVDTDHSWLIQPLVQLGHPTLLYGKGSSGKSWFAQFLAVLAHEGLAAGDLQVGQCPVLYLDWETDVREITSRVAMIRRGLNLPLDSNSGIWYKSMTQGLSADISTVMELVQQHGVRLVILDSLGSACMGEPESAEVVLRMFGALRSLGVTSLCIDHTNKEGTLFGSVYKFNASRQIFEVKKNQQEEQDRIEIALLHKKANNSRLIKPMGWILDIDNEAHTIKFSREDVRNTSLEPEMRVVDRIQNALRSGPMVPKDLAELLEKTAAHISKELSTHRDKLFVQLAGGAWANKALGETMPEEEEQWTY